MGAAYGTARSGAACAAAGVERPDLVMKVLIYLEAAIFQGHWETADSMPVTPPDSYGGYHLSVCARGVSAYSWGHVSFTDTELFFV